MMVYMAIGYRGSGYCGFLTAFPLFDGTFSGVLCGILAFIVAVSFGICAAGGFLLLTKVIIDI